MPSMQECRFCDGCGWYEGGPVLKNTCPECGGTGQVPAVVPAPAPAAGPSEPPYEAEQVKQAHAHLLDIVLRRKYSGVSLQKAIRALIAATHSATIQPR